mmetsp:Transcript_9299/g.30760  ORF Transcript_9299/g.30760 Transcript_9299/m.30760 type:complete len:234 (+) Transcript_9299:543-1244(+)
MPNKEGHVVPVPPYNFLHRLERRELAVEALERVRLSREAVDFVLPFKSLLVLPPLQFLTRLQQPFEQHLLHEPAARLFEAAGHDSRGEREAFLVAPALAHLDVDADESRLKSTARRLFEDEPVSRGCGPEERAVLLGIGKFHVARRRRGEGADLQSDARGRPVVLAFPRVGGRRGLLAPLALRRRQVQPLRQRQIHAPCKGALCRGRPGTARPSRVDRTAYKYVLPRPTRRAG